MHDLAVLAHIAVLEIGQETSVQNFIDHLQRPRPVLVKHEIDHRPADHFLRWVTENAFACGTDKSKASLWVYDADRIEQQIHDFAWGNEAVCFHLMANRYADGWSGSGVWRTAIEK